MKKVSILAFCFATSAAFGQSPIAGIDVRLARFFTSTADANFVANFVNTGPSGALPIFAIDYDASATTLWAVNNTTMEYGTINIPAATFTPVGVIGGIIGASGLTASPNGTTWYLSSVVGPDTNLYVGDITTGTFSLVGTMVGAGLVIDISMSSTGRLIAHSIGTDSFYDVNPATAVATLLGPHGLAANFAQGMDFDWSTDTLYATIYTGGGTGQFCTVNLTTGAVTSLAATTPLNAEMEIAIRVPAAPTGVVQPGADFWTTPGAGETRHDFSTSPIPPGFFGPGSLPFFGVIELHGDPLSGTGLSNGVDTIVQRLAPADLSAIGNVANVPIEMTALSLVSVRPIPIGFGTGTSQYDVRVSLSSNVPQPVGGMQISRDHQDGGNFNSFLPVVPRIHFQKVAGNNGVQNAVLDGGIQLLFQSPSPGQPNPCWSFDDGGFNLASSPGGQVDHDGDPVTPDRPFLPTSPNFHTGICPSQGPLCPPQIQMTEEDAMLAAHGVLPARNPMLVGRNICSPANPNSTGCPAVINGLGSDRVLSNNFSLEARGMPLNSNGFFLASRGQLTPPIVPVGSQGRLCIGPAIGRGVGGVIFNSGLTGTATVLSNLNSMPLPTGPAVVLPGDTWFFTAWYRDANPGITSNLTNGLEVRFR